MVKVTGSAKNTQRPRKLAMATQLAMLLTTTKSINGKILMLTSITAGSGSARSWLRSTKKARDAPHAKESKEMMVEMTIPVLKYPVQRVM